MEPFGKCFDISVCTLFTSFFLHVAEQLCQPQGSIHVNEKKNSSSSVVVAQAP
jgi:hypothetical protein